MKNTLLTLLRDKNTKTEQFRKAADQLGAALSFEVAGLLEQVEHPIQTPIQETTGYQIKRNIVLISILRAGIAMLNPFMKLFSASKVGFVGIKRDEQTALPHLYYTNLPAIDKEDMVIVLDPMIATGGSGRLVIGLLHDLGVNDQHIIYGGMIAAPEGISSLNALAPGMKVVCAEVDDRLNDHKYIVPGLGDFGDRYFGT